MKYINAEENEIKDDLSYVEYSKDFVVWTDSFVLLREKTKADDLEQTIYIHASEWKKLKNKGEISYSGKVEGKDEIAFMTKKGIVQCKYEKDRSYPDWRKLTDRERKESGKFTFTIPVLEVILKQLKNEKNENGSYTFIQHEDSVIKVKNSDHIFMCATESKDE